MKIKRKPTVPYSLFPLGNLYSTRGINESLDRQEMFAMVARHACGDWGICCQEDKLANQQALKTGARLLSVYRSKSGDKIWIITEADRSATTVLYPSEY